MQNIMFMLVLFVGLLQADTVGVSGKSWVDAPMVTSTTMQDMQVGEELVIPAAKTPQLKTTVALPTNEQYRKIVLDFINPLWFFMRENVALFSTFMAFISMLFYLFFYRPLAKRVRRSDDEDIMIPQAFNQKDLMKTPITQESAILTQSQYSTLYGLINETSIYEKENVLLDKSLTQEQRNREVISLEWKFNQILHFSLPKLSTNESKRFKEGVKELLEEEITRDIMMISLEDILKEDRLKEEDKVAIKKMIEPFSKVERRQVKTVDNLTSKSVNYTSYMMD